MYIASWERHFYLLSPFKLQLFQPIQTCFICWLTLKVIFIKFIKTYSSVNYSVYWTGCWLQEQKAGLGLYLETFLFWSYALTGEEFSIPFLFSIDPAGKVVERRKQIKIEKENHFVQYQPKYHPWLEKKGSWTFCGHKPCWACLLSFKYFTCWKLCLQVKLTVSPLPTLSTSDKLWCTFGETSHRAQLNEGVIICDPPDMIPPTPKGQGKEILLPAKHRKRKNMNHCF